MKEKSETSAGDFTTSFEQKLIEQFGEAPGELMTEGEYRADKYRDLMYDVQPRFSEFFGVSDDGIEVEYSRYRFALADRPDMAERWAAIQREYARIAAAREALASE